MLSLVSKENHAMNVCHTKPCQYLWTHRLCPKRHPIPKLYGPLFKNSALYREYVAIWDAGTVSTYVVEGLLLKVLPQKLELRNPVWLYSHAVRGCKCCHSDSE